VKLFGYFIVMLVSVFVFSADAGTLPATSEEQAFLCLPVVHEVDSPACVLAPLANQIDQNQPNAPTYMTGFSQT